MPEEQNELGEQPEEPTPAEYAEEVTEQRRRQYFTRRNAMITTALLAILLVYMVLASQFKSLVDPLVIMFSVPLGIGEGSETNLPLARAVIGGLTVSTFFTLFLVPSLYTALDRFARRKPGVSDDDDDEDAAPAQATPHAAE
jgi:multidrug efflux pump subunit AcrB